MSVPSDDNLLVKKDNKISKYNDKDIEIERMKHFKTITVPVIVRGRGISKKIIDKNKKKSDIPYPILNTRKNAFCGTAHFLRGALLM